MLKELITSIKEGHNARLRNVLISSQLDRNTTIEIEKIRSPSYKGEYARVQEIFIRNPMFSDDCNCIRHNEYYGLIFMNLQKEIENQIKNDWNEAFPQKTLSNKGK